MNCSLISVASIVVLAAAVMTQPANAQSEGGPWVLRVRAVQLVSANKDDTGLDLSINDKVVPELDVSYYFMRQWSAELILTYPQKQEIRSGGTKIGTLKHLPPTLTGQYHFIGMERFNPYIGAGINYTRFSGLNLPPGVDIERGSVGLAFQVGVDIPLRKGLLLNLDAKKVQIRTDVNAGGSTLGKFKVDPLLLGVGLGWQF